MHELITVGRGGNWGFVWLHVRKFQRHGSQKKKERKKERVSHLKCN